MTTWNPKANEIFLAALEINSPHDRLAYVDQACGNELGLRADVNGLLAAADNAHSFLSALAAVVAANRNATEVYHHSDESPGDPATTSVPTSCWNRSAKGALGQSTWRTRLLHSNAGWH